MTTGLDDHWAILVVWGFLGDWPDIQRVWLGGIGDFRVWGVGCGVLFGWMPPFMNVV